MSYAKLFASITESSLWSEEKNVRLLFISMLARADSMGFVEASVLGLARMANLTDEEVEMAIEVLEGPDPHSKNPENEGRRILKVPGGWTLLNYESYRNRRSDEDRREYMRNYMADYRRKQSVNSTANKRANSKLAVNPVNRGKPPLAQEETEAEAEERESASPQSPDGDALTFEEFIRRWNAIPGVSHCKSATAKRRTAFNSRMCDPQWESNLGDALAAVAASKFLRGENERGWQAHVDWFLRPDSLTKVIEGQYSAATAGNGSQSSSFYRDLSPPQSAGGNQE